MIVPQGSYDGNSRTGRQSSNITDPACARETRCSQSSSAYASSNPSTASSGAPPRTRSRSGMAGKDRAARHAWVLRMGLSAVWTGYFVPPGAAGTSVLAGLIANRFGASQVLIA